MLDLLRKVFGKEGTSGDPSGRSAARRRSVAEPIPRSSNGLRHFFDSIPRRRSLQVLDLGGVNEANINFLSELGGKIHAVDLLESFDRAKREDPSLLFDAVAARDFLDEYLNFPRKQFDAILVWDTLELLDPDLLHQAVARLGETLRPGGGLLAFFHTQARGQTVQVYRYRILSDRELVLQPRHQRPLPNTFNNRSLERLFGDYQSVKFFLTRDNLREVIAVR